MTESEIP